MSRKRLKHTGVELINPTTEDGTKVSEKTVVNYAHTAPNKVVVDFGEWMELIRELQYLQSYWFAAEMSPTKARQVGMTASSLMYQVQDIWHPEDPDRKYTGFQALSGEVKWPPKEGE